MNCPALCDCRSAELYTISVPPPLQRQSQWKRKRRFFELRLMFFAILKEEIQSCDRLKNTLLRTRGGHELLSSALPPLSSNLFFFCFFFFFWRMPLKCNITKYENTSMSKKYFKSSYSPWVFALSYIPLYDVSTSVLCKDIHRLRCRSPWSAEVTQLQIKVSVLRAVLRGRNNLIDQSKLELITCCQCDL